MSFNFFWTTCVHNFTNSRSNNFSKWLFCDFSLNMYTIFFKVIFKAILSLFFTLFVRVFYVTLAVFLIVLLTISIVVVDYLVKIVSFSFRVNVVFVGYRKRTWKRSFSSFIRSLKNLDCLDLNEPFFTHFFTVSHDLFDARRETA